MNDNFAYLCGAAASIGFVHTILGPDHYIPFVAMSRAGRWSLAKTVAVTLLCGAAHVLSSAALGAIGIAFGIAVLKLETAESARGDIAGWLLLAFGLAYFAWGAVQAARNKPHTHLHVHPDGTLHEHLHVHQQEHMHAHAAAAPKHEHGHPHPAPAKKGPSLVPWALFAVFIFGPCEPLIPLLMYPAAKGNAMHIAAVTLIFGAVTMATMLAVVLGTLFGTRAVRLESLHRYSHALAGLALAGCGAAIKLGL